MKIVDCECCIHKGIELDDTFFVCLEHGESTSLYFTREECDDFKLDPLKKELFREVIREEIDNIDEIIEIFKE